MSDTDTEVWNNIKIGLGVMSGLSLGVAIFGKGGVRAKALWLFFFFLALLAVTFLLSEIYHWLLK